MCQVARSGQRRPRHLPDVRRDGALELVEHLLGRHHGREESHATRLCTATGQAVAGARRATRRDDQLGRQDRERGAHEHERAGEHDARPGRRRARTPSRPAVRRGACRR